MPTEKKKMVKKKVLLLAGGPGSERDISLESGDVVCSLLPEAWPVRVEAPGRFMMPPEQTQNFRFKGRLVNLDTLIEKAIHHKMTIFPLVHGKMGEDGSLTAAFQSAGLKVLGSSPHGHALAFNKIQSRLIVKTHGLSVAPGGVCQQRSELQKWFARFPSEGVFVKDPESGSTDGVVWAKSKSHAQNLVRQFLKTMPQVLVEKRIRGQEVSVPVIDIPNQSSQALPPVAINPQAEFFDRRSKYVPGASEEICPAPLPKTVIKKLQAAAVTAHQALGLHGLSRSDFIVRREKLVYLETNSLPGMTEQSLLWLSAKQAGYGRRALLRLLLKQAQ